MYFFMTGIEAKHTCLKFLMNKVLWMFLCFVWKGLFRKTLNHISQHSSGLSWSVEMLERAKFSILYYTNPQPNQPMRSCPVFSLPLLFLKIQARKKIMKNYLHPEKLHYNYYFFCMGLGGGIDTVLIPHLKAVLGTHLIHYLSIILFTGKTKWWEGEMG